jgi:acetyl esterase/lipase
MSTPEPIGSAEVLRLWPDGPPTTLEGVGDEVAYPVRRGVAAGTTFLRNISDPTLTVFPPPDFRAPTDRRGVVVVPGGGWTINAWSHEGVDVARWLAGAGHTVFLLKYRVQGSGDDQAKFEERMARADGSLAATRIRTADLPRAIGDLIRTPSYRAAREAAADDGRRALALAREHAGRFGVDPGTIGMIGFSAGAFLAVDVTLDPRDQPPPAWVAAIYGGETLGRPVPADAPPLFTAAAQDDALWKIVEGLHADWSAADRPSEHHLFARGGHGFGMVRQGLPSDRWTDLFLDWLAAVDPLRPAASP